jgi:PEP-CTERM putative exosortase interaction domain
MLCSPASAVIDDDDANRAEYLNGWGQYDDASSNPSGFGGWVFDGVAATAGTTDPRYTIASSTTLGPNATGIDSGGVAFKIHEDSPTGLAGASRFFDPSGLNVGETVSFQMAVNFTDGFKGFDLLDNASNNLLNLNVGGGAYNINNETTLIGAFASYQDNTYFTVDITQDSLSGGSFSILREGSVTESVTGTFTGLARSLKFYNGQSTGPENALFVNNLSIVPEPGSFALLSALSVLSSVLFLRRRRSGLNAG